jgi:hypothetical protein
MNAQNNKHLKEVLAGLEKAADTEEQKQLADELLGDWGAAKHHAQEVAAIRARAEKIRRRLKGK